MAFSLILTHVLSNQSASNYIEERCVLSKSLPTIAIILDILTCIALAALAIINSQGLFGSNFSSATSGLLAGGSFGIACLTFKQIVNSILNKLATKHKWSVADKEENSFYVHYAILIMGALLFSSLFSASISSITSANASMTFFNGFGIVASSIVCGTYFLNAGISFAKLKINKQKPEFLKII